MTNDSGIQIPAIAHPGITCRIGGDELVVTYRETTVANPGVTWQGEWSVEFDFWLAAGVRYEALSTHTSYRMVEARISRNRETEMFFGLAVTR